MESFASLERNVEDLNSLYKLKGEKLSQFGKIENNEDLV
jgi:hypothetical protein